MKNFIILGIPFYDIPEFQDKNRTWDSDQETFIKEHVFISEDPVIWLFGQEVDNWTGFKSGLKVKPDDLAYVQRIFLEKTEKILGIKPENLQIMGITVDEN